MSGRWIYVAISLIAIGCTGNFFCRILIALGFALFYRHELDRISWKVNAVFMLVMLILSAPVNLKMSEGRVVALRNGYQIIRNGLTCAMIYSNDSEVSLDDIVRIDCELEKIDGYDNFELSTFALWAKGQQICWQGSIRKYEVIDRGISLRRLMYEHNRDNGNGWINQLLLASGMESDSDYRYFFTASGMHVSFLAALIRRLYGRRNYPLQTLVKTIRTMAFIGLVFRFPYGYVRVLINLVTELFIDDDRDRVSLRAILLALYRPYYVRSIAYLIPTGLAMIGLFCEKRSPLVSKLFVTALQLHFYGYCNILNSLFFSLGRTVSGISYCLALMGSFLPVKADLSEGISGILSLMDRLPQFCLNGRLPLVGLALACKLLTDYCLKQENRYFLMLALLFVLNHYQSVLNPFYCVEFLDIGQGDCSLVTVPFSTKGILIDTGGNVYKDVGSDIVVPFLRSKGLTEVEVIISHGDYDHCGALASIGRQFRVSEVDWNKEKERDIDGLKLLSPLYDRHYEEVNDDSQLTYFRIDRFGFLYLGDISEPIEEDLVNSYQNLDVSVVKIAHHGSRTATGDALLSHYRVPFAVISAGRNNRFDHPHQEVVERLRNYGVNILCTSWQHAIRFRIFHGFMIYSDADGSIGLYTGR